MLCDKKFSGADTVATSRTLSEAIKKLCPDFDLIICGQYAADGDTAQTGPSIAQKLDIEQITYVAELKPLSQCLENTVTAIRKADEAIEAVETNLPALICVSECPFAPRNIRIDGYLKAQDGDPVSFGGPFCDQRSHHHLLRAPKAPVLSGESGDVFRLQ